MGTLAGMDPHVSVQLSRMFESPRANLAFVRALLRVNPPVHAEVLLHAEALVAELAAEGFFASVRPVMTRETRRDGEGLRADVAAVRIVGFFGMVALVGLEGRF